MPPFVNIEITYWIVAVGYHYQLCCGFVITSCDVSICLNMCRVDILEACSGTFSWVVVAILIYLECHWMLPSIPTRGHGLVLLILVTISFIFETLALLSWFSPLWWWTARK